MVVGPVRRWKYSPPVTRLPTLRPGDLDVIEDTVASLGDCRLLIVDPVYAYQGGDGRRPAALRTVLTSLDAMADRLGIAIIGVTYLTHRPDVARGKYRVLGSTTYQRICQSLYMLVRDRENPGSRRVLMVDQSRDVPFRQPDLSFVIDDHGEGPVVEWNSRVQGWSSEVPQTLRWRSRSRKTPADLGDSGCGESIARSGVQARSEGPTAERVRRSSCPSGTFSPEGRRGGGPRRAWLPRLDVEPIAEVRGSAPGLFLSRRRCG